MTSLNLTHMTSDQSILITGQHPTLGIFLVLLEHDGHWPTYTSLVLDGALMPFETLGVEVVEVVVDLAARILANLTPPQPTTAYLTTH